MHDKCHFRPSRNVPGKASAASVDDLMEERCEVFL